jgi:hypothetical protein
MSHVVFCWELGGGMGHLVPLTLVAAEIVKLGHKVTFVMSDVSNAPLYLEPLGIEWIQGPHLRQFGPRPQLENHADILRMVGYDTPQRLMALLSAWRSTFGFLRPDRVICEYAPTAQLASQSLGLSCICIDNGFSMPPVCDPLPPLRLDKPADIDALRSSESKTLTVINEVLGKYGASPLPRFSSLYETAVWYRNWTEFNHFGPHSSERHLGQIFGDTGGAEPEWPGGSGRKMFAYVKPDHPFALEILQAAANYGFRILAYLPGRKPSLISALVATGKIIVSPKPIRLSALDNDVEIGIWQSPTGGVGHSLEKGMRMLFLPSQAEQYLACKAVERSGVPACVVMSREDWPAVFDRLLAMPRMTLDHRWLPANIPDMAVKLLSED